jgi:type I restriction enzyme S subunit
MLELGKNALKIGSGATPRGGKSSYLDHGPYALVRSQNVHNHGFEREGLAYISEDQAKKLSNVKLLENDVLINITGDSVARVCLLDPSVLPARVNQHVAILRPDPGVIDPLFLRYFLVKPSSQSLLLALASAGATRNAITKSMLESLEVPDLDVGLQRSIGRFLKSLDDKIELNRRMNETLEEMARALFRDWFVDFGPTRRQIEGATDPAAIMGHAFPPEKATPLAPLFPTKLGDDGLPEGWEKRVLHDLTDWVNGAAYKNMHFSTEADALPVIKIAELKAGVTKTTKHTNTALGNKYRIKNGEVLFSWSGNPDTSIDTFIWSGGDAWLNQHIFAVRPNGEVDQSVLYFLLKYLRPQFAEIARDKQTTGLGHVTKQDLKGMRVCLGSGALESAATEIFSPLFAKLYANQQENQTLAEMRDLLLPKLMSGEIRLKDAEGVV